MKRVTTASGAFYEIDDVNGEICRQPAETSSMLYADQEWVTYHDISDNIVVGQRFTYIHEIDGREVYRMTTPVVSIEEF